MMFGTKCLSLDRAIDFPASLVPDQFSIVQRNNQGFPLHLFIKHGARLGIDNKLGMMPKTTMDSELGILQGL